MPLMYQEKTLQMEWCLDCHRDPEKYVRPREEVTTMDYVPAEAQSELGPRAGEGIQDRRHRSADVLLDVPPMKHRALDSDAR